MHTANLFTVNLLDGGTFFCRFHLQQMLSAPRAPSVLERHRGMSPSPKKQRRATVSCGLKVFGVSDSRRPASYSRRPELQIPDALLQIPDAPLRIPRKNGISMLQERISILEAMVTHLQDAVEQQEEVIADLGHAKDQAHLNHCGALQRALDAESRLEFQNLFEQQRRATASCRPNFNSSHYSAATLFGDLYNVQKLPPTVTLKGLRFHEKTANLTSL